LMMRSSIKVLLLMGKKLANFMSETTKIMNNILDSWKKETIMGRGSSSIKSLYMKGIFIMEKNMDLGNSTIRKLVSNLQDISIVVNSRRDLKVVLISIS